MTILPIGVHNEQNGRNPRLDAHSAQCMPPLFSSLIHAALADQAVLILKNQCRQLE